MLKFSDFSLKIYISKLWAKCLGFKTTAQVSRPTAWMLHFDLPDKITCFTQFRSIDFHKLYYVWKLMTWGSRIGKVYLENCKIVHYFLQHTAMKVKCVFLVFLIISQVVEYFANNFAYYIYKMYIKPNFDKNKCRTLFFI